MRLLATLPIALLALAGVAPAQPDEAEPPRRAERDIVRERRTADPYAAAKDAAEGQPPPALPLAGWRNAPGEDDEGLVDLAALTGTVVLVAFVDDVDEAQPALRTLAELHAEWAAAGMTALAVVAGADDERLDAALRAAGVTFPVRADPDGAVGRAWLVDDRPDHWFVGRDGRVRAADVADPAVGSALQRVLRESPLPARVPAPPTSSTLERARTLAAQWPRAVYGLHVGDDRIATWSVTNAFEPGSGGEDTPKPPRLVAADELVVTMGPLRLTTTMRCTFELAEDGARLLEAEVTYSGRPEGETSARLERGDDGALAFRVRGEPLRPGLPVFTDVFLARAPALMARGFDPAARRAWMNFVDGRLYEGVYLRPAGFEERGVLGTTVDARHWRLSGQGQAAPSDYWYDEHGGLVAARLEHVVEVVLERRPEPPADEDER